MREIILHGGTLVLVDDEDYERINRHRWYKWHNPRLEFGVHYAVRPDENDHKKQIRMHREILNLQKGMTADHIDGNGLNNQKSNLRVASQSQNGANSRKFAGKCKYKGIRYRKDCDMWRARIKVNYTDIPLGSYLTEEQAALAYDNAARKYFGEFARLNFPKEGERGAFDDSS